MKGASPHFTRRPTSRITATLCSENNTGELRPNSLAQCHARGCTVLLTAGKGMCPDTEVCVRIWIRTSLSLWGSLLLGGCVSPEFPQEGFFQSGS